MLEVRESTVVTARASVEKISGAVHALDLAPGRKLLEARLLWGGDTLAVRHFAPREEICICDLGFDIDAPAHADEIVVAGRDETGEFVLVLPNGAIVPAGCRVQLHFRRATLRLTLVADDALKIPRARPDGRVAAGVFLAAALHFLLLALVAHGRADQGISEEAARADMVTLVIAAEERAAAELNTAQQVASREETPGPASANKKEEAMAGNPAKTDAAAQGRITRGEDRHASKDGVDRVSQRPTIDEVATFGILALLAGDQAGARSGTSPFAVDTGPAAMGNMFGQTIDDAAGMGGLGLTGAGEGGGGLGEGVAFGRIGTIGRAAGVSGTGQGFGRGCSGCVGGSHKTRSPSIGGGDTQVNGRLPPEVIQRIVRQSFGRLRGCYARGLERRPDLEGRIAVKFVIDREGNVVFASAAEQTLDDNAVAACVVKAYEAMSFPKPEGGIVTVVYPVVFTNTSP